MTLAMPCPTDSRLVPLTPLCFARRANRALDDDDFDDESDNVGHSRYRRPRRRPFLKFVLILLVIAGVWYVVTDPDVRSSVIKRVAVAIGAALKPGAETPSRQPAGDGNPVRFSEAVPVPAFREGQRVVVTPNGRPRTRLRLSRDAEGTQRGPSVNIGDVLTIRDGRLVKRQWVYIVQTHSGASGWIPEHDLRARP